MHTIRESNYTVIKQPCNGNSMVKKITKNNSVHRSYQAQVMRWSHSMIFKQIIHSYLNKRQGGRRTFSTFFKKDRFLDMMIVNVEHACSHKHVVRTAKSLQMARSEMTGHSFLVLIQNHRLCFENSSCKLLSFNISANSTWAWQVCSTQ